MSNPLIKNLRDQILRQRRMLAPESVLSASRAATERFLALAEYRHAEHIAAYYPVNNEIDPRFILETALADHKKVYLPVLAAERSLKFAAYSPEYRLRPNQYGIPEPECDADELHTVMEMDVLIVPLVCFDQNCNRIGMGAGYYDRTLAQPVSGLKKIGLAYDMQRVQDIEPASWDVPMDIIVTEREIYRRD